jgi:myo-inositol-1(or 4)-monophosphatase
MDHGECVAGNPRIYGQLVGTLGRYSKFAGAGDKAAVRQSLRDGTEAPADTEDGEPAAPVPAAKPTLKAKRIKAGSSEAAPEAQAAQAPNAPF